MSTEDRFNPKYRPFRVTAYVVHIVISFVLALADGSFHLEVFDGPRHDIHLNVLPPASSAYGIIAVELDESMLTKSGSDLTIDAAALTSLPNIAVKGKVSYADGTAGAATRVVAVPLFASAPKVPLSNGDEVQTNDAGEFNLTLDEGTFRLDIIPGSALATRTTRFVTLQRASGTPQSVPDIQQLDEVKLPKSRLVAGTIRRGSTGGVSVPAVGSTVRIYRVSSVRVNGLTLGLHPVSLMLGETITDSNGNFTVALPTY